MISIDFMLPHNSSRRFAGARITAAFTILLALTIGGAAFAAEKSRGVLWKIETAAQAPSYLFGTIHIGDPRVTRLPAPVRSAFNAADRLIVEVVPDMEGMIRLTQSMRFNDERTLTQTVGAPLVADARAALAKRNLPPVDIEKLKPWAIVLMLLAPDPSDGLPLDIDLQNRAAKRGIAIDGLETMDEQIAVFDELNFDDQRGLLESTLRDQTKIAGRIEALTRAYLARDLAKLESLSQDEELGDAELTATVMRRLLTDRNQRMVARMQPWLREGNAFIAVGAAHLSGPKGLLELLERKGYRISAVY